MECTAVLVSESSPTLNDSNGEYSFCHSTLFENSSKTKRFNKEIELRSVAQTQTQQQQKRNEHANLRYKRKSNNNFK